MFVETSKLYSFGYVPWTCLITKVIGLDRKCGGYKVKFHFKKFLRISLTILNYSYKNLLLESYYVHLRRLSSEGLLSGFTRLQASQRQGYH